MIAYRFKEKFDIQLRILNTIISFQDLSLHWILHHEALTKIFFFIIYGLSVRCPPAPTFHKDEKYPYGQTGTDISRPERDIKWNIAVSDPSVIAR